MKIFLSCVLVAGVVAFYFHATATPQFGHAIHQIPITGETTAMVSIRQNDGPLCGTAFYDDVYALTVSVFADGASAVQLEDYQQQVFGLIRRADEFKGEAEAFVEHVKDIPRQLVEIIKEDPTVLDSCDNFSVALVGPP